MASSPPLQSLPTDSIRSPVHVAFLSDHSKTTDPEDTLRIETNLSVWCVIDRNNYGWSRFGSWGWWQERFRYRLIRLVRRSLQISANDLSVLTRSSESNVSTRFCLIWCKRTSCRKSPTTISLPVLRRDYSLTCRLVTCRTLGDENWTSLKTTNERTNSSIRDFFSNHQTNVSSEFSRVHQSLSHSDSPSSIRCLSTFHSHWSWTILSETTPSRFLRVFHEQHDGTFEIVHVFMEQTGWHSSTYLAIPRSIPSN